MVCCQGAEEIHNPVQYYLQLAKHLLRYVRASKIDGLMLKNRDLEKDIRKMAEELERWYVAVTESMP